LILPYSLGGEKQCIVFCRALEAMQRLFEDSTSQEAGRKLPKLVGVVPFLSSERLRALEGAVRSVIEDTAMSGVCAMHSLYNAGTSYGSVSSPCRPPCHCEGGVRLFGGGKGSNPYRDLLLFWQAYHFQETSP